MRPGDTIPPNRTLPVTFGANGSLTSYGWKSPVPKHATYRILSSRDRLISVTSGGTAPNRLSGGGSDSASAGSAGIVITSGSSSRRRRGATATPTPTSPRPTPPRRRSRTPSRVVRRPQLERHLMLVAEVERPQMAAVAQIPHMNRVAVLAAEQQLGHDAVLEHSRRAPLARQPRLMPRCHQKSYANFCGPRSTSQRPSRSNLSRSSRKSPPAPSAPFDRQAPTVDRVGAAMDRMRAGVARARDLLRLDRPDQVGRGGSGLVSTTWIRDERNPGTIR